ncbi:hypothetical protein EST38_g10089 [Candolleomyces aberdarensis]|uniref:Uncharacterized protein n=1 Tax=Candolleomyces aberdarensis TaxID=2316362 RepID=A0A4Q2D8Y6_9AGAR|nr:hypothetical protein EST38_g10089 [Candolleomyces aberdarensis]
MSESNPDDGDSRETTPTASNPTAPPLPVRERGEQAQFSPFSGYHANGYFGMLQPPSNFVPGPQQGHPVYLPSQAQAPANSPQSFQPQHEHPVYAAPLAINALPLPQHTPYHYYPTSTSVTPFPAMLHGGTFVPAATPNNHQLHPQGGPSTAPVVPQPSHDSSTAGGTSDAETGTTTETESVASSAATGRPKKRRLAPADDFEYKDKGKRPEQAYNNHPVPDVAVLQQLQAQYSQIAERLDHLSNNIRVSEPQQQSLTPSVEVMQQLIQGFKENTEILREGFRIQAASNRPDGEPRGANDNMDIDPSIQSSSLSKIEIKEAPISRTDESKGVARIVRDFFKFLLKGHISTVDDWCPTAEGPVCTVEDFRLDFERPPNAPWNKFAKKVFLDTLVTHEANKLAVFQPPLAYLGKLYVSNFRNARTKFKWEMKTKSEKDEHRKQHRRNERKRWLYYRRIQAAKRFRDTMRHLPMIAAYGWEGMSTDESDHENGTGGPSYVIMPKKWRHPNADQCLRTLDGLHRDSRFRQDRRVTPGAHPHMRHLDGRSKPSVRTALRELPTGLYNPQWLGRLTDAAKEALGITETIEYDFSHTPEIEDISRANNGKADSIYPYA